jgi:hypothetical protein
MSYQHGSFPSFKHTGSNRSSNHKRPQKSWQIFFFARLAWPARYKKTTNIDNTHQAIEISELYLNHVEYDVIAIILISFEAFSPRKCKVTSYLISAQKW